jgi:peptidoglycan LD-endopeptidase CwlK
MTDRALSHLHPKVEAMARAALGECAAAGIDVLVTCTYRSGAEQDALFAKGRNGVPGPKVTNARAGQSLHQYRVALDIVIMVHGKPDWSGRDSGWMKAAAILKKHGFEWGYDWPKFKEMPHFQFTGGHPLSHFQAGGSL